MKPLQTYTVVPKLPKNLRGLWELAYNFLFAWNDSITDLFARIDARLWRESEGNPVAFINKLPQETLLDLSNDELFLDRLKETREQFSRYMDSLASAAEFKGRETDQPVVAYFSFEFGISHGMPIYSGGLGILAGDHLKSASDLNVPLVGVGLCYRQGYFRQYLTPDAWQNERYPDYDLEQMPLTLLLDDSGNPLSFELDYPDQRIRVQVWQAAVGRVKLYLMDTNIPENPQEYREMTTRLYGGDLEMRIRQEILLGIGGTKCLALLGLKPTVIHMNEGHSAFAGLERIRVFMAEQGLSFEAASELTASSAVFTTHTPVPAGNDRFPPHLMQKYFEGYAREMGVAFKVFMAYGREDPRDDAEHFCMTVLALRLSRFNNGVSHLHGEVSRKMWQRVWPQFPLEDVPIGAVTNGVHHPTWVADEMALLYDRFLGPNWREDPDCERVWKNADVIPDAELWRTHERLRERLVDFVRMRLRAELKARGARSREIEAADDVLDPSALTIGFARRFATYKRANLLLHDKDRLMRLITDQNRPIQFIFAGKAHPHDNEGKKLIQELVQLCRSADCRLRMVFLSDYDMEVASYMVQGCDVWLNTPRVPLEACGTSGMKAVANGALHMSTLDGWWAEAWLPDNSLGWSIGQGEYYTDHDHQDFVESQTIYNLLENDVLPAFYDRGHGGLPRSWIRRMKQALLKLGPVFNSHRMVEDYVRQSYQPAYSNYQALARDGFAGARQLAEWRMDIMTNWGGVAIRNVQAREAGRIHVGEGIDVSCEINLNGLTADDLLVEAYAGHIDHQGGFVARKTKKMESMGTVEDGWTKFVGRIKPGAPGRFGYTVRVLPNHPNLLDPHSLGLIHWA